MKVNELRIELDARKLNSKGLKAQLVARLQEAVTKDQEEETKVEESEQRKNESNDDPAAEDNQMDTTDVIDKNEGQDDVEEISGSEHSKGEEPEVMEVDRKKKTTEKRPTSDDDIFVKPAPAMDEKQKQALTAAYKLPGMLI